MPSELKMLFFTPELYRRFNAPDDDTVLAADAEWETAIARYHEHVEKLRAKMPSEVAELAKLCLHDGEILQRQEQQHPVGRWYLDQSQYGPFWPLWLGLAILAVQLDNEVVTLFYFLSDHVTEQPAAKDWPFSKAREHWLYDEIHVQGPDRDRFIHLILLSGGVVLTIPFATVAISRFPLSQVGAAGGKHSA
jgi:hypothetical protein